MYFLFHYWKIDPLPCLMLAVVKVLLTAQAIKCDHTIPRQNTLFQNGRNFSILLFTCKLALVALFKDNILLNFEFKNEATRANLQENKRILKWRPFWNKVYWSSNKRPPVSRRPSLHWPELFMLASVENLIFRAVSIIILHKISQLDANVFPRIVTQ